MNTISAGRRARFVLAGALAVPLAATACGGEDAGTTSDGTAEIRLATVPNLVGWSVWGAQDLGFFEENDLEVTSLEVFDSGPPIVETGLAGEWDVAFLGSPPAIVAGEKWDLKIAGVQNEEAGNIILYVREGEVDLDDPAPDLTGKQALVVGSSLGEQVYQACLESLGMQPDDMELVPLEPPQIANSFTAGDGTVAQVWSELVERMDAEGFERLCTGTDAGTEVYTVFVVHPDFAAEQPEAAARAIEAIFDANELLKNDLDGAMESLLAFYAENGVDLTEEDIRAESERHDWYSLEESTELLSSGHAADVLGATAEFFVTKGQYDEVPEFDFLAPDIAEAAVDYRGEG
ncbi:ABC transporter substrate-binding protein [Jiangella asiatica]|uniref:SsuA/THI5-like domain-containing protein n=1 Tax=Jiangella asiatica TaxID=2530372 RepID=A0A4V6PFD2_9ACTN|nr:ABC transporter substrate-binding protein [Jiangella asiatica]TDE00208.1 hypothetical protein E1269_26205 [Jiangella asiatica]